MPPNDWHFGVVFPLVQSNPLREHDRVVVARFRVQVTNGDVRAGCVDTAMASYLGDEIEVSAQDAPQDIEVEVPKNAAFVVFRTALTKDSRAPVLQIDQIKIAIGALATRVNVVDVTPPAHESARGATGLSRLPVALDNLELLVSHSTRRFDLARASAEFLRERYANRDRLKDVPPFESLPSASTSHSLHGALTRFRMRVSKDRVTMQMLRCIDSRELIQQATVVGKQLVMCSSSFLCALPSLEYRIKGDEFDRDSPFRVDDLWFAGLHSIVPTGSNECLVSAAGPDAAMWVDLATKKVTRRFRLPESLYGINYSLTPSMSVHEHYIPNDYQLGHLNSAYPDDDGGCYVTTLGQGDIGHFDRNGTYELVASGYVGLHGLRRSLDGTSFYFSESPSGKLRKLTLDGSVATVMQVRTNWLHDAQQIASDIFVCLAVDRNELILLDVRSELELATFDLSLRGLNPQFVSVLFPKRDQYTR